MAASDDEKEIKKSSKKDITGAADLEKVTDYAPEKDISEQDAKRVRFESNPEFVRSTLFGDSESAIDDLG